VIQSLLEEDNGFLSQEKTKEELQRVINIIKDEITITITKQENKETKVENKETKVENKETKQKINQSKENINKLYTDIPEEFKYKKETADQKIEAEADSLFLKAKDKLQ
jgi:hypothetical protein